VFLRERKRLAANPAQAKTLVDSVPILAFGAEVNRVDAAAWFFVATILLNLDETISK
jgi:hypothetical protein